MGDNVALVGVLIFLALAVLTVVLRLRIVRLVLKHLLGKLR